MVGSWFNEKVNLMRVLEHFYIVFVQISFELLPRDVMHEFRFIL